MDHIIIELFIGSSHKNIKFSTRLCRRKDMVVLRVSVLKRAFSLRHQVAYLNQ